MATKQVICDTDVIIDYWDNKQSRHLKTRNILEDSIGLSNVFLSGITQLELMLGALTKEHLRKIVKNISYFDTIPLTPGITEKTVELIQTYFLSHGLNMPDGFIAATAIVTNMELFTYNTKDYKFIKGLSLFEQ
jgi:predicted nucleic acid-binding protein